MAVTVAAWMVVFSALPSAPPELLLDVDSQPSRTHQARLAGANADGLIFTQFIPDGGSALFWSTWDGPPVELAATGTTYSIYNSTAVPLGDGFVVFRILGQQYYVEHLALSPEPHLEPLATVTGPHGRILLNESKTRLYWASSEGTYVTDGTEAGTRKLTSLNALEAVLGEALYFHPNTTVIRWEDGGQETLAVRNPAALLRAGQHLVFTGRNPTNEAAEALSSELTDSDCFGLGADRYAWLACNSPDGGRDVFVTDGTPAGTSVRYRGDRFLNLGVATDELLLLSANFDGGAFVTRSIAREGPPVLTPYPCPASALLGQTVLCAGNSLSSLTGAEVVRLALASTRIDFMTAAGTRALVQIPGQAQFTISDGTREGTRLVPAQLPAWPTESSRPRLFATDGVRALYNTTLGVWLTDGTREGTFRAGDDAEFFGHSVLAANGSFVVYGADGREWQAPFGTIGVAGGVIVGKTACDAFMVDEERNKTPLAGLGCVELIKAGRDGALIRNSDNQTFLLRKGHQPYPLPGEVQFSSGVSCGDTVCWYLARSEPDTFVAQRLLLASGEVNTVTVPLTEALPFEASDWVFTTTERWSSRFALHPDHTRTELMFPFTIGPDGHLLGLFDDGVTVINGAQRGRSRAVPGCLSPWQLAVTGNTVHALCGGENNLRLFSGGLDGGEWVLRENEPGDLAEPSLPSGADVWAFSLGNGFASKGRFVMSDGQRSLEVPNLIGSDFTRVRGGYVFAGTRPVVPDLELWVVPAPEEQKGCGCGQVEAICSLGLVLLLRRRRSSGQ